MSSYSTKFSVETAADGKTKTCSVLWQIPKIKANNISELRTSKADWAEDAADDTKFLFKIKLLGKVKNTIEIYYLAPELMYLKYSLKDRSRKEISTKDYAMVQPNKWNFMLLIYNISSGNFICENGDFDLHFEFTINKEIKLDLSYHRPKAELNCDLENVFNNSIYSDVTIKSAERVEFQTHKVVLAARSAVLKAHFEHNTVESVTNIIETLETNVLKEVLRYIYTDNTPEIDEMPEKLLAAADYYQLSRLKSLCEEALFQKLTVDNAIATVEIAELHSAKNLTKVILEFIRDDGCAALITKTKAWAELQSAALVKTIFEYVLN